MAAMRDENSDALPKVLARMLSKTPESSGSRDRLLGLYRWA
jgi:hypothetical protein